MTRSANPWCIDGEPSARIRRPPAKGGPRPLRRSELPVDTIELARYLLGKTLVHDHREGRMSGRIVETEAYVVGDAAGHAFRGETPRNRSLFLEHGHAYVYFIYGSYYMLNVVAEQTSVGGAVLLRALEPLEGVGLMQKNRHTMRLLDLARGPGRLATALDIDRRYDGMDLCSDNRAFGRGKDALWLGTAVLPRGSMGISTRIGLTKEVDRTLRFYERGSKYVSGPKRLRN